MTLLHLRNGVETLPTKCRRKRLAPLLKHWRAVVIGLKFLPTDCRDRLNSHETLSATRLIVNLPHVHSQELSTDRSLPRIGSSGVGLKGWSEGLV